MTTRRVGRAGLATLVLLASCKPASTSSGDADAGQAANTLDAGPRDGGTDAGAPVDAGGSDAGHPDAGWDAGHTTLDAGTPDAAMPTDAAVAPDAAQPVDSGPRPDAAVPWPPASTLPFVYTRADVGTPLSPTELTAFTDRYVELLHTTRWMQAVTDRLVGWPAADPAHGYWYGTWWSGVGIELSGGNVTFRHVDVGGDNNGLRTPQVMEGACYAYLLTGAAAPAVVLETTMRGYSQWIMGMERTAGDTPVMMTRAIYPPNITWTVNGHTITLDHSASRPGVDNGATEYVHIAANPHWGDIWVKNKRSKDDLGHMFRGLGQISECAGRLGGGAAQSFVELKQHYQAWSMQVVNDGYRIATLDKTGAVTYPTDTLAWFTNVGGAECAGMLMVSLVGQGNAGTLNCGSGISTAEALIYFSATYLKPGNKQMLRTYHEAAANHAILAGQTALAETLVKGLGERLDRDFNYMEQNGGSLPPNVPEDHLVSLVMHAANVGVPLTSREVRWLQERFDRARTAYLLPANLPQYTMFSLPDGAYVYEPSGDGVNFTELALPLGSCASPLRNPAGKPLLDCARVQSTY